MSLINWIKRHRDWLLWLACLVAFFGVVGVLVWDSPQLPQRPATGVAR